MGVGNPEGERHDRRAELRARWMAALSKARRTGGVLAARSDKPTTDKVDCAALRRNTCLRVHTRSK